MNIHSKFNRQFTSHLTVSPLRDTTTGMMCVVASILSYCSGLLLDLLRFVLMLRCYLNNYNCKIIPSPFY